VAELLDSTSGPFRRSSLEKILGTSTRGSKVRDLNLLVFLQSWWNEFIS
jgi:hypothetical protein